MNLSTHCQTESDESEAATSVVPNQINLLQQSSLGSPVRRSTGRLSLGVGRQPEVAPVAAAGAQGLSRASSSSYFYVNLVRHGIHHGVRGEPDPVVDGGPGAAGRGAAGARLPDEGAVRAHQGGLGAPLRPYGLWTFDHFNSQLSWDPQISQAASRRDHYDDLLAHHASPALPPSSSS
ncbi:hypothetical protein ZWY2020_025277 [Hordeum vulgare]|nr:hypothetical protein ZWY2020_025277 [Hordeum vulgare]